MKECSVCKMVKPLTEYHRHRMGKGGLNASCKDCKNSVTKTWRKNNPRKFQESAVNRTWWRRSLQTTRWKAMERCVRKGIPFTITQSELISLYEQQRGRCSLSGIEFLRPSGGTSPYSLSMDRIKPGLGYVEGNVRLVLLGVNSLKLNGTDEDVFRICKAIVEKIK